MFRLALRNLLRNKRRTAITTLAIAGGLMMIMIGNNLNHGMYLTMLDTGISTTAGHVVVQGEGWEDDPDPLDYRVEDASAIAEKVRAAHPEGLVLQRVFLSGLIRSANNSVGIAVTAVEPDGEKQVHDFHEKLILARYRLFGADLDGLMPAPGQKSSQKETKALNEQKKAFSGPIRDAAKALQGVRGTRLVYEGEGEWLLELLGPSSEGRVAAADQEALLAVVSAEGDSDAPLVSRIEDETGRLGSWLESGDERGILLGAELARTLEVRVGKKVVLQGQSEQDDPDGPGKIADVNERQFKVRGIFRTGSSQADGFVAFVTVEAAQEFLGTPGAVSQVSLHLENPEGTVAALADVKQALSGSEGLEILGWQEAVEELYEFTVTDRATNNKIMFFIGLIVALGILNTVLMSVMERMREFGVILALGMSPGRLRRLILTEGLLLGLFASSLGLAGGSAVTHYLVNEGIDYSEMMGETMDIAGISVSTFIFAGWDTTSMAVYTLVAVLLSVAATIYPAWKAGKLQPVEAMRHV